jgi:hypothetical protein
MGDDTPARLLWTLFGPIHAVTYFAPQSRAAVAERVAASLPYPNPIGLPDPRAATARMAP